MLGSLGRDVFAGIRTTPASATGAFTADSEQTFLPLDLQDLQIGSEESLAIAVTGIVADVDANEVLAVVAANWQQADDAAFSVNAEDIPGSEARTVSVAAFDTAPSDGQYSLVLSLNMQLVTRRYVRAQVTITETDADTHASSAVYLIGPGQQPLEPGSTANAVQLGIGVAA